MTNPEIAPVVEALRIGVMSTDYPISDWEQQTACAIITALDTHRIAAADEVATILVAQLKEMEWLKGQNCQDCGIEPGLIEEAAALILAQKSEIKRLRSANFLEAAALAERVRIVAAMRDAIGKGYPTLAGKTDQCVHGKFGWDDCIACYDEALELALQTIERGDHTGGGNG